MPTLARLPIRKEVLKWSFALYACLSLVSMAAMSIGAAILGLAIFWSSRDFRKSLKTELETEIRKPAWRWMGRFSILLFVAAFLSLVGAWLFPLSYAGQTVSVHFIPDLAKSWYFAWPFLLVIGLRRLDRKDQMQILNIWLGAFAILSVIGIFQYFTGWPRPQGIPGEPEHYHATLFLGHHLSVASIFIFPLFAALDFGWKHRSTKKSLYYFIAFFLGSMALYFTYSRALWVGLPVGLLAWVFLRLPRRLSIAVSGFLLLLGLAASNYPPVYQRLHDSLGVGPRQDLWSANLEFFKNRPVTGVGWRKNQELSGYYLQEKFARQDVFSGHAHNNFLEVLAGMGLLGIFAWLGWCIMAVRILFLQKKDALFHEIRVGMACAWIVFHLNGLTQVNFWEGKVEHQIAWIIAWSLL